MRMSILKLFFYRNMDVTINNFKKKIENLLEQFFLWD